MSKRRKSFFRAGWKDYLAFSTRERNGVYALLVILVCQISFSYYLNFSEAGSHSDVSSILNDSDLAWMKFHSDASEEHELPGVNESNDEIVAKSIAYFKFDPNLCTAEEFKKLGLTNRQALMIINYRNKGGKFRKKNDFKKMYCINESQYIKLEPWIALPDSISYPVQIAMRSTEKKVLSIDLSKADSLDLTRLRGIGPVFARRIIRYRERLGGFTQIGQLKEVWGMTDSLFLSISSNVFLSDSIPGSIALNTVELKDFGRHPYVGFDLGKVILNYRDQHGPFRSVDDIKKVPLVTEEIFRKLAPYLSLEIN